jgi:hypothetical protein
MNDKAFEFALEATKQVLVLSSGFLALSLTVLKETTSESRGVARWFLKLAWVLLFSSIACGVLTILALTGVLAEAGSNPSTASVEQACQISLNCVRQEAAPADVFAEGPRLFSSLQGSLVGFAFGAFRHRSSPPTPSASGPVLAIGPTSTPVAPSAVVCETPPAAAVSIIPDFDGGGSSQVPSGEPKYDTSQEPNDDGGRR